MPRETILVTENDMDALTRLVDDGQAYARDREHLATLAAELDRAQVVSSTEAPDDLVTMGSRVRVRDLDTGEESTYTLAYSSQGAPGENRISVLAPIGTALLGYREGDEIEWSVPGGVRRLVVLEVSSPPPGSLTDA